MKKEIWKDVIGYEDCYRISNYGNVVSKERYIDHKRHGRVLIKERLRKHGINNKTGRRNIKLSKEGSSKSFPLANIIALHFIDNPHNYPNVIYKDGDFSNNHISNLMWVSSRDIAVINRKKIDKTSKSNGVWYAKDRGKYRAAICVKGKSVRLGSFDTEEEAKKRVAEFKSKNKIKDRFEH